MRLPTDVYNFAHFPATQTNSLDLDKVIV